MLIVGCLTLVCAGLDDRQGFSKRIAEIRHAIAEMEQAVQQDLARRSEKLLSIQRDQVARLQEEARVQAERRQAEAQNVNTAPSPELMPVLHAYGTNGQLHLLKDRLRITRDGFTAFLVHGPIRGTKEILLSQISAIQFQEAGIIFSGFIRFSFLGGTESRSGMAAIANDENAVMFRESEESSFRRIKREIEARMSARNQVNPPASQLDEIEKLAALRSRGIITDEEFAAKKKQLLGI